MQTRRLVGLLGLCFLSHQGFATVGHYYLGGSVAASFAQLGSNSPQISYTSGVLITDAYPLNNTTESSAVLSLNGGYEFSSLASRPAIALGLGIYGTPGKYSYTGQLVETAAGNPSSALYDYQYSIKTTRLMAEMQMTWKLMERLSPFINLGLGPSWNQMNGYTEMASTSNGYPPLPPFLKQTQTRFAYQAVVGISLPFSCKGDGAEALKERMALGYRYANLGGTSFGSRGVIYPYALNTGSLSTNEVYLAYTHLF
ncbi:MAG: outer membrane protein [Legionellales bacterium]